MHKIIVLSNIKSLTQQDDLITVAMEMDGDEVVNFFYGSERPFDQEKIDDIFTDLPTEKAETAEYEYVEGGIETIIPSMIDFIEDLYEDETMLTYHNIPKEVFDTMKQLLEDTDLDGAEFVNFNETFINCDEEENILEHMLEISQKKFDLSSVLTMAYYIGAHIEAVSI